MLSCSRVKHSQYQTFILHSSSFFYFSSFWTPEAYFWQLLLDASLYNFDNCWTPEAYFFYISIYCLFKWFFFVSCCRWFRIIYYLSSISSNRILTFFSLVVGVGGGAQGPKQFNLIVTIFFVYSKWVIKHQIRWGQMEYVMHCTSTITMYYLKVLTQSMYQ